MAECNCPDQRGLDIFEHSNFVELCAPPSLFLTYTHSHIYITDLSLLLSLTLLPASLTTQTSSVKAEIINIACLCWFTKVKTYMAEWPSTIPCQYQPSHSLRPILRPYLQGKRECLPFDPCLASVNMCVLMGCVLGVCCHGYLRGVFRVVFRDYWHVNGSSNCDNRTLYIVKENL